MAKTTQTRPYRVIGLMSGTSLDGVDAALIETDGQGYVKPLAFLTQAYQPVFRDLLRRCLGNIYGNRDPFVADVEQQLTALHAKAVQALLKKTGEKAATVDLVGFHGQTTFHDPKIRKTIQIGDGPGLAAQLGIPVVNHFRIADVAQGGQGAPLVPLYHRALFAEHDLPIAVLNIGGVANITWLGADGDIAAFDTGPGNALIDDWVSEFANKPYDRDGAIAAKGQVDWAHVRSFLKHPYFEQPFPKSLDRDAFQKFIPTHLKLADGAATLTAMTVGAVCQSLVSVPEKPLALYVTGGGRRNSVMMKQLQDMLSIHVETVEKAGFNGDAMEAEAFGYLAVRSKLGLPLSLPSTTGVKTPVCGGQLHLPKTGT